jgi:nucleotide-binding universal stress UspA family protein
MRVVVWVVEGTWRASVDAARLHSPSDAEFTLLYVVDDEVSKVAHGAFAGLMGRGRRDPDPGAVADDIATRAGEELLHKAGERLQRPHAGALTRGRSEREVVRACDGADLLVVARDGDRARLGPRSLGHTSRFVVDHAPCPVLLIWPGQSPELESIPPPPPPGRHHPPPPGSHPPAPHG